MFEPDPDFDREMDALFDALDEQMAHAAADFLRTAMNKPGGGIKWPGLPNTSSAPGEYPVVQHRKLLDSLDAQQIAGEWHFGSFNAPPEAWSLEYPSPSGSPITRQSAHGARPWLSKLLGDPVAHAAIWASLDTILGR